MLFLQITERHPSAFVFGCLTWVPLAFCVMALVHWMIGGEIDVVFGVAGIFVSISLGYVALNPPSPIYSALTFFAVLGTVVLFPFFRAALRTHALRVMDFEALENAYAVLAMNGTNVAARMRIARLIFDMGFPGHALRIAENCITTMPQAFFVEEYRIIQRWRMTPMPPHAFDPIRCVDCGQENPPGNVNCAACGSRILLDRVRGRMMPSSVTKKLLAAWITMVGMIAGIPIVSHFPILGAVTGLICFLALGGTVLYLAFRPEGSAS